MKRTVRQLQAEINADEFAQWMAYDLLYPIGQSQTEHLLAELCAQTFNIARDRGVKANKPDDYRMMLREPTPELTPQEQDKRAHALFGGLIAQGK